MASKTKRKGVGLRPREPGDFSGPRVGAIRLHKSSGICQIVLTEVLEDTTVLHRKMFQQEQFMLPRPFRHFSYRLLASWALKRLDRLVFKHCFNVLGSSKRLDSFCRSVNNNAAQSIHIFGQTLPIITL